MMQSLEELSVRLAETTAASITTSSTVIQDLCYGKLVLTIIKNIQDSIKVRDDNKRIKWTEYCATKICRYSCQSSFQIRQRYNYLNLSIRYMIKTRSLNIDITISKHASLPHVWCLINRFWRLWANSWAHPIIYRHWDGAIALWSRLRGQLESNLRPASSLVGG